MVAAHGPEITIEREQQVIGMTDHVESGWLQADAEVERLKGEKRRLEHALEKTDKKKKSRIF